MSAYQNIPSNWSNIKDYFIKEQSVVIDNLLFSNKLAFYDTCSIRNHTRLSDKDYIIDFLKKFDYIIMTRTLIMELSKEGYIVDYNAKLIKELSKAGVKFLLMEEEWIYDILLRQTSGNVGVVNSAIINAINVFTKLAGTTHSIKIYMDKDKIAEQINKPGKNSDPGLAAGFFQWLRSKKTEHDSLAENIFMLLAMIWANFSIPDLRILSDDKKMDNLLAPVQKNLSDKFGINNLHRISSFYILAYEVRSLGGKSREQIIQMFSELAKDGQIQYKELSYINTIPVNRSESPEVVVDKLLSDDNFKIVC